MLNKRNVGKKRLKNIIVNKLCIFYGKCKQNKISKHFFKKITARKKQKKIRKMTPL